MNFQTLKKVEDYKTYLDIAFKRAKKKSDGVREHVKIKTTKIQKSKDLEMLKLDVINQAFQNQLGNILTSFPNIDSLDIFYVELIKSTISYNDLKKSLGAIKWAAGKTDYFYRIFNGKIKKTTDMNQINVLRREYYGRVSSVMKQIKTNLLFLEEARKIMKGYPNVKTSMFTVCIFGFPNVGKSTLLKRLTGAEPEISSYAFTTKSLNMGYIKEPGYRIQVMDTPGTLNRTDKMNNIELQAYLALNHVADMVIYVFDPTDTYDLRKQKKLLKRVSETGKSAILYLSKTDIVSKERIAEFKEMYPEIIMDTDELKKLLKKKLVENTLTGLKK